MALLFHDLESICLLPEVLCHRDCPRLLQQLKLPIAQKEYYAFYTPLTEGSILVTKRL